jgi:hypothetical protein
MGIFTEYVAEIEEIFIEGDGCFGLIVDDELNYQKHLKFLSRRWSKNGGNKELIAKLHYENLNPKDNKAIRVVVNGGTVGYLSFKDARLFRERLEKVDREGLIVSCHATITGGERTWFFKKANLGVCLDLPIEKL